MSNLMKRAIAMLLVLASCICFIPAVSVSASAADVSYVYDGETVYNWGTRGEVANFLSPNAEKYFSWENLVIVVSASIRSTRASGNSCFVRDSIF